MPSTIDRALGRERSGRGGNFKPLLPARITRALSTVIADTQASAWVETVGAVLDYGAALLLSPTSDGGAFSITILDGDERLRTYCATADEVAECLSAVYDHCTPDKRITATNTKGARKQS